MGIPWDMDFRGTSVVPPWCFHEINGTPMGRVLLWESHDSVVVLPWDFQGDSVVLLWDFHGTFMVLVLRWGSHDLWRCFRGTFMERTGDFCETSMGNPWVP